MTFRLFPPTKQETSSLKVNLIREFALLSRSDHILLRFRIETSSPLYKDWGCFRVVHQRKMMEFNGFQKVWNIFLLIGLILLL